MDDIVKAALAKWPNVPACYGWLGLDARGQWWMRDDRAQALGSFTSGVVGAKGSLLQHEKLIEFIHRNYDCVRETAQEKNVQAGQWFFQNGPQRVYVELEATPLVWRIHAAAADGSYTLTAHTGQAARAQRCITDEHGRVYVEADIGFGLVHSQDVLLAAAAVEQGLWVPLEVPTRDLPARFGYVRSPQAAHAAIAQALLK